MVCHRRYSRCKLFANAAIADLRGGVHTPDLSAPSCARVKRDAWNGSNWSMRTSLISAATDARHGIRSEGALLFVTFSVGGVRELQQPDNLIATVVLPRQL
jgi:hypothetical protein